MLPGIVEFLLEAIEDDEALARAALNDNLKGRSDPAHGPRADDGRWTAGATELLEREVTGIGIEIYGNDGHTAGQAKHIAHWDPSRVLSECLAKRRLIAFARARGHSFGEELTEARLLTTLALAYADRDGYEPGWAGEPLTHV
jgi:hypothetical protein